MNATVTIDVVSCELALVVVAIVVVVESEIITSTSTEVVCEAVRQSKANTAGVIAVIIDRHGLATRILSFKPSSYSSQYSLLYQLKEWYI